MLCLKQAGKGVIFMAKGKSSGGRTRSASSGRFVTKAHARRSPRTIVTESRTGRRTGGTFRSAISGRFVTTKHGKSSPGTTIKDG